jgi:hypothetical protein
MYSNNFQATEPYVSVAMGLFKHLNIDELKEILNDDNKCEEMIKDVKQVSNYKEICNLCMYAYLHTCTFSCIIVYFHLKLFMALLLCV